MKASYKIALVSAVVLFAAAGGWYFLSSSKAVSPLEQATDPLLETLSVQTTDEPVATKELSTPKPIEVQPKTDQGLKDLTQMVRARMEAARARDKVSTAVSTEKGTPVAESVPTLTFGRAPEASSSPVKPVVVKKPVSTPTPSAVALAKPKTTRAQMPDRYIIQPGDTLSSIALTLYGSERQWVDIAQANPLIDPLKLKLGQEIKLPPISTLRHDRRISLSPPGQTAKYIVRAGDNLSTIAHEFYNNADQWRRIYNANRGQIGSNPDNLQAGVTLTIPPDPTPTGSSSSQ